MALGSNNNGTGAMHQSPAESTQPYHFPSPSPILLHLLTCIVRSYMLTLQVIHGASAGRARVHVHVEGLVVQTVLVNGRLIVIHCCDHLRAKGERDTESEREREMCV